METLESLELELELELRREGGDLRLSWVLLGFLAGVFYNLCIKKRW